MTIKKIEQQHSFFLQKFSLSLSLTRLLILNSMNANRDLPQYYYITSLSLYLTSNEKNKNKIVLQNFYGKNYHNRILISIFFISARYCNQGLLWFNFKILKINFLITFCNKLKN